MSTTKLSPVPSPEVRQRVATFLATLIDTGERSHLRVARPQELMDIFFEICLDVRRQYRLEHGHNPNWEETFRIIFDHFPALQTVMKEVHRNYTEWKALNES